MSRSKLISKEEAIAVCEKLNASGRTVSSFSVRSELGGGTGSYTTILAAIKEFKARPENGAKEGAAAAISLSGSGVLQQLWPVNPPAVSFAEKGTSLVH